MFFVKIVMEKREWFAFLFFIILFFPAVSASGVSPPQYGADFTPGAKLAFSFTFFGTPDSRSEISVKGDLAEYVSLSESSIIGTGTVIAYLSLPNAIERPGPHYLAVVAREIVSTQGMGISGEAQGTIVVHVPYPGVYIESSLEATDVNQGEPVPIKATYTNRGKETVNVFTSVDILQNNKTIETLVLDTILLAPTESKQVSKILDTASYRPGSYTAAALISYGGKTAQAEANFRIGTLFVDIVNNSDWFDRDKINRFEIDVESAWNSPISNVFANVTIPGTDISLLTPSISLKPFERSRLTGFFDTTGITDDPFPARIILSYEGAVTEKIVELHFKRVVNYTVVAIVAVFALVVLVLVFIILRMRRALNTKRVAVRR